MQLNRCFFNTVISSTEAILISWIFSILFKSMCDWINSTLISNPSVLITPFKKTILSQLCIGQVINSALSPNVSFISFSIFLKPLIPIFSWQKRSMFSLSLWLNLSAKLVPPTRKKSYKALRLCNSLIVFLFVYLPY